MCDRSSGSVVDGGGDPFEVASSRELVASELLDSMGAELVETTDTELVETTDICGLGTPVGLRGYCHASTATSALTTPTTNPATG